MSGLNAILDVCKWATLSQQANIEVIGNNIANVNTPGYSRQKVVLETGPSITTFIGQMGTGVRAVTVQREYDKFINSQLNFEKQMLGNWKAQDYYFQGIEGIFDEPSEYGLSAIIFSRIVLSLASSIVRSSTRLSSSVCAVCNASSAYLRWSATDA